jgi:hypothetical protein
MFDFVFHIIPLKFGLLHRSGKLSYSPHRNLYLSEEVSGSACRPYDDVKALSISCNGFVDFVLLFYFKNNILYFLNYSKIFTSK